VGAKTHSISVRIVQGGFAVTLSLPATTETRPLAPLSRSDLAGAAWGACQICLVADRVASLRTGSTHKVYRGWRIEVSMHHGRPGPGMTLFTIPIDPTQLTASQTKYALVQWGNQGDIAVGRASAFSWSTTSIGTADPFATALDEARWDLGAAGWSEDGAVPMCYVKSDPAPPGGKTLALPGSDADRHGVALPGHRTEPRPPELDHLLIATKAQEAVAGLDGWETDGGTYPEGPAV
jgi:hypothetical protein